MFSTPMKCMEIFIVYNGEVPIFSLPLYKSLQTRRVRNRKTNFICNKTKKYLKFQMISQKKDCQNHWWSSRIERLQGDSMPVAKNLSKTWQVG